MSGDEKLIGPLPTVGKQHEWGFHGKCTLCGMTRTEAEFLGPHCTFVTDPNAPKLLNPADDKPDGVQVEPEYKVGVGIPDPSDVLAWAIAGGKLYMGAINRLLLLRQKLGRADLCHVIRWAVGTHGDELHISMRVTLP